MAADTPMREFSRSLPMSLMRARETVMGGFRTILNSHDLTEQQWRVLRALAEQTEGLEIGELSEHTLLLGPSLSRIVTNMEERDLLHKSSDPEDGRKVVVSATRLGTKLLRKVAPQSEAHYAAIEANFGSENLEQLQSLLDELSLSLDGLQ